MMETLAHLHRLPMGELELLLDPEKAYNDMRTFWNWQVCVHCTCYWHELAGVCTLHAHVVVYMPLCVYIACALYTCCVYLVLALCACECGCVGVAVFVQ